MRKMADDIREQDNRLNAADQALRAAQTDADRRRAQDALDKLRQGKLEMERRLKAAQDAADKRQREKGFHPSKECMDNPLAKGC